MPAGKEDTFTVNTPVVAVPATVVQFAPPNVGFEFKLDQTIPRAVTVLPPSLVTLPPKVAVVFTTDALVGVLITGAVIAMVVAVAVKFVVV